MNMDTYYLEYDTPRAGGFEPLQYLPKNKNVILGIITSKFPQLENLDEMHSKVFQAADIVAKGNKETQEEALQRMGISPQVGIPFFPSLLRLQCLSHSKRPLFLWFKQR